LLDVSNFQHEKTGGFPDDGIEVNNGRDEKLGKSAE